MRFLMCSVILIAVLFSSCNSPTKPTRPTLPAKKTDQILVIKDSGIFFVHYIQMQKEWEEKYLGKTIRLRVHYLDSDELNAVFTLRPDDCFRKPYVNMHKLEEARTFGPESPFGTAIYATKNKDVITNNIDQGQAVTIDIIIDKMQDSTRLICHCVAVEIDR